MVNYSESKKIVVCASIPSRQVASIAQSKNNVKMEKSDSSCIEEELKIMGITERWNAKPDQLIKAKDSVRTLLSEHLAKAS